MKKTILALSLLVGMSSTASVFAALPQSIRIGTDATYAPFSSKDAKGDFVGFDIDLGNELCSRIKVKCTWVGSDFDSLIPSSKRRKSTPSSLPSLLPRSASKRSPSLTSYMPLTRV